MLRKFQIDAYLSRGWALVALAPGQKRPIAPGWNLPENLLRTREAAHAALADDRTGVGVHLAASGVCSLDLDALEDATIALHAVGVDATGALGQGWSVISGRPDKGRALYAAPAGALQHRRLRVPLPRDQWPDARRPRFRVVLELRGGSAHLQDVLPPSVHPDTRQPYRASPFPAVMPPLPPGLAALWREWDGLAPKMLRALGVEPALVDLCAVDHDPTRLRYPAACRRDFNAGTDVQELLAEHGYTASGSRWAHAGASGTAGVRKIPGKLDLWQSDNFGDPLCGTFDAWTAFTILSHLGDVQAATQAWEGASGARAAELFGRALPAPSASRMAVPGSLDEISRAVFSPRVWLYEELLTAGAVMLVGRPKVGKSWLMLQLLIAAAGGDDFLDWRCRSGPVECLYVAAEDDQRRLHERVAHLGRPVPRGIHVIVQDDLAALAKRFGHEVPHFHAFLEQYLRSTFPAVKLVVLDTPATIEAMWAGEKLESARGAPQTKVDYQASRVYDQLALRRGLSIVLLHHTSKRKAGARVVDYHELVNTTNTSVAGCSASLVLADTPGYDPNGEPVPEKVFAVRGRDLARDGLYLLRQDVRAQFSNLGAYYATQNSDKELLLLKALHDLHEADGWASSKNYSAKAIAAVLGGRAASVEQAVSRMKLSGRMAYGEYTIQHARGPGGGLRLVRRDGADDPIFT